jgi:hypothetical protein
MTKALAVVVALVGLFAGCDAADENDLYKSGPPLITNQPASHGAFQKGYLQVLVGGHRPGVPEVGPNYVVQGGLCLFDGGAYLLTQDWFVYHPGGSPTQFITWGTYASPAADTFAFTAPLSKSGRVSGDSITFSGPTGPTDVFIAAKGTSSYPANSCQ